MQEEAPAPMKHLVGPVVGAVEKQEVGAVVQVGIAWPSNLPREVPPPNRPLHVPLVILTIEWAAFPAFLSACFGHYVSVTLLRPCYRVTMRTLCTAGVNSFVNPAVGNAVLLPTGNLDLPCPPSDPHSIASIVVPLPCHLPMALAGLIRSSLAFVFTIVSLAGLTVLFLGPLPSAPSPLMLFWLASAAALDFQAYGQGQRIAKQQKLEDGPPIQCMKSVYPEGGSASILLQCFEANRLVGPAAGFLKPGLGCRHRPSACLGAFNIISLVLHLPILPTMFTIMGATLMGAALLFDLLAVSCLPCPPCPPCLVLMRVYHCLHLLFFYELERTACDVSLVPSQ
eukprot:gene3390-644_t